MRHLTSPVQFGLRRTLAVVGLLSLLASGLTAAETPTRVLRAGAYAIDITPTKFPVSSSGSMTHRTADSAHDPLHARCLVLDNGETKIALVTCDSCMIRARSTMPLNRKPPGRPATRQITSFAPRRTLTPQSL